MRFENFKEIVELDYRMDSRDLMAVVYSHENNYWFYHDSLIDTDYVKAPIFRAW